MFHYSEIFKEPHGDIENPEHYLWFKLDKYYYPDIDTYRQDPYPENFRELAEQDYLDKIKAEA